MDAIHIPQLIKAPERTESLQFKEFLSDLDTLIPVQGGLQVTHQVNYLEVSGQAETIVTLTCDRCLQQYNHRLTFKTSEFIWLEAPVNPAELPPEREVLTEELVETLPPHGDFQPDNWVYEQLCLALPYRQLCDSQCPGIAVSDQKAGQPLVDQRWASLAALKNHLPT
jgi:uncharacterized protein